MKPTHFFWMDRMLATGTKMRPWAFFILRRFGKRGSALLRRLPESWVIA